MCDYNNDWAMNLWDYWEINSQKGVPVLEALFSSLKMETK